MVSTFAQHFSLLYHANYRLVIIAGNLYDVYNTTQGAHHTLRFKMHKNLQYRYARLTVVQFTANGQIRKYYPRHADYELVTPDAVCEFEISRHMWKPVGEVKRRARATATFKAFITLAPTSFDTIEESRIRTNVTTETRDQEVGDNHQIPALADTEARAWAAFRDTRVADEFTPPARWRTMTVTIHTTRN